MRRTFSSTTGIRRGMNHQGGAQGNVVIRSYRDTCIGDASGVKPEAPKGVRLPNSWEREMGKPAPANMASGSRRGD